MRYVLLLIAAALTAGQAQAQNLNRGPCCNTQTNQFVDIQDIDACNAMPGHLHSQSVDQTNMMQLMGCLQNSSKEAMQALQDYQQGGGSTPGIPAPAMPPIPGVPGGGDNLAGQLGIPGMQGGGQITSLEDLLSGNNVPTMDDVPVQCCDTVGGAYAGIEPPKDCRARGTQFVPELPETMVETQMCRPATAGGGGAWDKEDFEANITHADMEDWQDENKPEGFTSWGPDPSLTRESGLDLQVTFRSPDAHTGQWSLRMKPADILPQVPEEGRGVAAAALGTPYILSPTGTMTCEKTCEAANPSMGMADIQKLYASLDAEDVKSHICGAYKGFIGHQDQLKLDVSVHENGAPVAGLNAQITESSADWTTFAFPMQSLVSKALPKTSKVGMGLSVVPKANGGMPGMRGWDISPFTDVLVDSIHFCSPVKLMAFKPAVIDDKQSMIPESVEEREGVQTWVNSDNDDKDKAFDFEDTDGVTADDELVHIKMQMPKNSFGNAELKVSGVGKTIKLWDDASKSKPFVDHNQRVEVLELLRTTNDGERYERDLWVEAIAPSDAAKDVEFEFIFENAMENGEETTDKVTFTALAPVKISFKGKGNGEADKGRPGDDLKEDPSWPAFLGEKAYRVFPGKPWEGSAPAATQKDEVSVEITMNVDPVRPVSLFLKSFDVDDPNHFEDLVDDETKVRDNRGYLPAQSGLFKDGPGGPAPFEFKIDKKEMETPFQVTRQPGDNFRIAASGDKDHFKALANDDDVYEQYSKAPAVWIYDRDILDQTSDPALAKMPRHEEATSPVLTVWRRLWLEVDHMEAVKKKKIEGIVQDARDAPDEEISVSVGGVSEMLPLKVKWVDLDVTLGDFIPKESTRVVGTDFIENSWARGRVYFTLPDGKKRDYMVSGNTGNVGKVDSIKLLQVSKIEEDLTGATFKLVDDDKWQDGDAFPEVDLSRVEHVFSYAYILPMVEDLLPGSDKIPFQLHAVSDQETDLKATMAPHFKNKGLDNDPYFWVVYIQNGFQGSMPEDGDGSETGALAGITDNNVASGKGGWGIFVYQESAREAEFNYSSARGWRVEDVAPHELGHMFGGVHAHGWLMSEAEVKEPPRFDENTLKAARSRDYP